MHVYWAMKEIINGGSLTTAHTPSRLTLNRASSHTPNTGRGQARLCINPSGLSGYVPPHPSPRYEEPIATLDKRTPLEIDLSDTPSLSCGILRNRYTFIAVSINENSGLNLTCDRGELVEVNGTLQCPTPDGQAVLDRLGMSSSSLGRCAVVLLAYIIIVRCAAFVAVRKIKW